MTTPGQYGIIYNWDGAPHGYSTAPQSLDEFLQFTYAPLIDTQVGALFWWVGEHAARWSSTALEQLGDVEDLTGVHPADRVVEALPAGQNAWACRSQSRIVEGFTQTERRRFRIHRQKLYV